MIEQTAFDEWLDATYPVVKLLRLEYKPSDILKECDPIAYRIYSKDWQDSE